MSDIAQEVAAIFGGMALLLAVIFGAANCSGRVTAEKMRACAAMCPGALAEYRDDECRCGGRR